MLIARAGSLTAVFTQGVDILTSNRLHLDEGSSVCCVGPCAAELLEALQVLPSGHASCWLSHIHIDTLS